VRWAVTANLMVAWIVTIPASGLIAGIFWYIGTKFL
ncbi:MAG: inorganic phosphate transporter, partial [Dechloromonas sp.]|nr:inorganic phosphate transporter [Dechloromonas sp.]